MNFLLIFLKYNVVIINLIISIFHVENKYTNYFCVLSTVLVCGTVTSKKTPKVHYVRSRRKVFKD